MGSSCAYHCAHFGSMQQTAQRPAHCEGTLSRQRGSTHFFRLSLALWTGVSQHLLFVRARAWLWCDRYRACHFTVCSRHRILSPIRASVLHCSNVGGYDVSGAASQCIMELVASPDFQAYRADLCGRSVLYGFWTPFPSFHLMTAPALWADEASPGGAPLTCSPYVFRLPFLRLIS